MKIERSEGLGDGFFAVLTIHYVAACSACMCGELDFHVGFVSALVGHMPDGRKAA